MEADGTMQRGRGVALTANLQLNAMLFHLIELDILDKKIPINIHVRRKMYSLHFLNRLKADSFAKLNPIQILRQREVF